MFPPPPDLDPRLEDAVEVLEDANPALRVVAARVYRLPVARLSARVALQQPRRFNILEEFVLRAAGELTPPPTPAELAALLGLDQLFIDSTLTQLAALKAVSKGAAKGDADTGAAITLTAQGRQFAAQGQALQPPEHKTLHFTYRAGLDDLALADPDSPPPAAALDLPILPGLGDDARERLTAQAQAAVKLKRVLAAAETAGLDLHRPDEGRLLTTVDQVAVDDIGFAPVGLLVVHDALAGSLSLRAVDASRPASREQGASGLQPFLDALLEGGRLRLADLLPAAPPAPEPDPAAPNYADRYREALVAYAQDDTQPLEIELLRASTAKHRARQLLAAVRHTVLLLYPHLTDPAAAETLRAQLQTLAGRGVIAIVGWGVADDAQQEPRPVPAPALEALHTLTGPDGLPAAAVWHVGGLYGQDVVLDHHTLVTHLQTSIANQIAVESTYVITSGDLVSAALDDAEPAFARAARAAWQSASQAPAAQRAVLVRCMLTWVAVRRPGEALSHLLKLAAALADEEPPAMLVAWECLTALLLALGRAAAAPGTETVGQAGLGAADLRRAVPEFLDWSDSVLPPGSDELPSFVASLRGLLEEHGPIAVENLPGLLIAARKLWSEQGAPAAGQPFAAAFAAPSEDDELPRARPKRRR